MPALRSTLVASVLVLLPLLVVLGGGVFTASERPSRWPTAAPMDICVWHWSAARRLSVAEQQALEQAGLAHAFCWVAEAEVRHDGRLSLQRRGGLLQGLPETCARHLVYRLERSCTSLLEDRACGSLISRICQDRRVFAGRHAGIQIDWDVPTRLLPQYARFLHRLRDALPDDCLLSCTALVSWFSGRLDLVADAVDVYVPQCYHERLPADPLAAEFLVHHSDPLQVLQACEGLERPYLLGLAGIEQVACWSANGRLRLAQWSVPVQEVLAGADHWTSTVGRDPREQLFQAQWSQNDGPPQFCVLSRPNLPSYRKLLDDLRRRELRYSRGVSIYRLHAPGTLPAMTAQQLQYVVGADAGLAKDAAAAVAAQLEVKRVQGRLLCRNPGQRDWLDAAGDRPLYYHGPVLDVDGPGWQARPACAGHPSLAAHADGSLIRVQFLPAGGELVLRDERLVHSLEEALE